MDDSILEKTLKETLRKKSEDVRVDAYGEQRLNERVPAEL